MDNIDDDFIDELLEVETNLPAVPQSSAVMKAVEPAPIELPEIPKSDATPLIKALAPEGREFVPMPDPFERDPLNDEALVDLINHPPHYRHPSGIETLILSRKATFDAGNAIKYVLRCDLKGSREMDLDKAEFYIKDCLEHADPILIDQDDESWYAALDLVCKAEPDPHKVEFLRAMSQFDLPRALIAVRKLIEHG